MTDLKLTYFNCRGLAETSRLLLAISGEKYEDFRYPLTVKDWKTHSFIKEEFDSDKKEGLLKKSRNKVPFLTVDNEVICQSKSIEKYLGRRFNMMGSNEIEAAQIDSICESVRDIKDEYQKVRRLEGDERDKGMNEWFNKTLVERLESLEPLLEKKKSVGDNVSLADVTLYSFITEFFDNKEGALSAIKNCPHIKSVVDNVSNQEGVKNWLKNRPETAF